MSADFTEDYMEEETVGIPEGLGEDAHEVEIRLKVVDEDKDDYIPEDHVRLPVGILKDGVRYREVVIEEMCGIDEHLVSDKSAAQNPALASTLVICRCVQEVEGLLPRKNNPEKQFDRSLGRAMTQVDRDFLLSRIQMLGGNNDAVMAGECPRCGRSWEESVKMSDLPVKEWPEDKPLYLEFELERGLPIKDDKGRVTGVAKRGKLRFPTGKDQELAASLPSVANQIDALLAACIFDMEEIGRVDQETVKRMKSSDRRELMEMIAEQLPGMQQWKEARCQCGKEYRLNLDLTSFFGGRRKSQKS